MKITKIEIQKKDKNRVNLFIDNEFYSGLSLESVIKNHLKEDQDISNHQLEFLKNESEFSVAYTKAGNILSKMQKTEKEVKDYLFKKGFEAQVVFGVVDKLKSLGYINDATYAKNFVKVKSRKCGGKKIAFELSRKGVKDNLINENIEKIQNSKQTAEKLLEKYLKNKERDIKTKQKAYRFLFSRGFDGDDVFAVLNKFFKEE